MTQETSFPGRIGKENEGGQEKPLDNRRYSQFKFDSEKLKTPSRRRKLQKLVVQVAITLHER